ncbi:MAG: putative Allophanate hydrolase, subunit 2 [Nitrospira sp.]|jgi:antagonist of KipI|nr:putative Allophanate hydrolase, subunit 2 [Nitrospira sp.]
MEEFPLCDWTMPSDRRHIHVLRPGLFTTIQDLGRHGFQRFGVSVSGAMDRWALRVGNRLLGNPDDAAGLEITIQGPELLFEQALTIAITGADLSPTCHGVMLPLWTVVTMPAGSRLQFGIRRQGVRAYLAVSGGLDGPMILGSRSTHVRSSVGSLGGRVLKKGDCLDVGAGSTASAQCAGRALPPSHRPHYSNSPTVRLIPGPHVHHFTDEALRVLIERPYRVTSEADRMGYRLRGAELRQRSSVDIVSYAVTFGALQIPPDGQPILLMADSQTTGGYATLATMIASDHSLAAQLCPGDSLSFALTSQEKASELFRSHHVELDRLLPPTPLRDFWPFPRSLSE